MIKRIMFRSNVEGDNHPFDFAQGKDCRLRFVLYIFVLLLLFSYSVLADTTINIQQEITPNVVTEYEEIPEVEYIAEQPVDFYFLYKGSNNNFTLDSQSILNKKYYTYNYNRFRNDLELGWENKVTFKTVLDLENYWGESYLRSPDFHLAKNVSFNMPLHPYHDIVSGNTSTLRSYLYRAYSTIYLPQSTLTLGYQRIPFGVGRIWNPTDILNPPNPISLETGERLGIYGAEYTYNLADLSQVQSFLTLNRDNKTKDYGFRIKSNYYGFDGAISAIRNAELRMSGIEIEREWLDTGVEVRLEAANYENILK
ncbi:MAG: hypothetical protein KKA19_00360, partial [Candidatus Margulisbacteria bacterium]|nr:hypothetical protein [Candidatus Margulisiibacteriota bacterium]